MFWAVTMCVWGVLLAPQWWRPGMLLTVLQGTNSAPAPPTRESPAPSVNRAAVSQAPCTVARVTCLLTVTGISVQGVLEITVVFAGTWDRFCVM